MPPCLSTHLVVHDVEGVGRSSSLRLDVDTIVLVHGPLAEDDPIVRPVKTDLHLHVRLAAHHVQALNVGHVQRPLHVPEVDIVLSPGYGGQGGQEAGEPHGRCQLVLGMQGLVHPPGLG